ncbi:MAG TPA: signal peptidase II [Gemmataceae bacterium]|jgi:signal peptidase II|nr:signal peptidase II [Gemmataceae bacterium]
MNRTYRALLFSLAAVTFVADQASKYGVFNALYQEGQRFGEKELVPGWFKLFVQFDPEAGPAENPLVKANGPVPPRVNHGALFSLGGQFKADANKFFAGVSILAATAIIIWGSRKSAATDKWLCTALGLILGGTLGNLFDRATFGGVRDFLYFYKIDWPVFNVADCGLVVGACLLLLQAVFGKAKEPEAVPAAAPAVTT